MLPSVMQMDVIELKKLYDPKEFVLNYDLLMELLKDSGLETKLGSIDGSDYYFQFHLEKTSNNTYSSKSFSDILDQRDDNGESFIGLSLSFVLNLPYICLEILSEQMDKGICSKINYVEKDGILFNVMKETNSGVILRII